MYYKLILALGITTLSIGCTSNPIKDLEFVSIETIESDKEDEVELRVVSHTQDNGIMFENLPNRKMLKVTVSTKSFLELYAAQDSISNMAFLCNSPELHVELTYHKVFSKGQWLKHLNTEETNELRNELGKITLDNKPNEYYIYIFTKHYGNTIFYEYGYPINYYLLDLEERPRDVCIKLVGGTYRKFGFESNIVKIPKEILIDALN